MLEIFKLRAENKRLIKENQRLREEIEQKKMAIQYLNGCVNKANRRTIYARQEADALRAVLGTKVSFLDFPNSSVEADRQISIHDILEN